MKKSINPQAIEIQKRFFEALDLLIDTKQCGGLQTFCKEHDLNRVKYSNIRTELRKPNEAKANNYKVIDLDALAWLCKDYNVSSDWILLNKGNMFKR
ncbi:MAG: hypothetical protein LBR26_03190 [Prevotella sp.]|jgi:hypothetical protein|nr:hypothetical protein [Prevotella sp.]